MSEREQHLEAQLAQQEAELRRLQEQLMQIRQAPDPGDAAAPVPRAPSARPTSAHIHGSSQQQQLATGGPIAKRSRYMFSSFPTTLLAPFANGPQLYPCEGHSAIAHEGRVILFGGTNGSTITNDTIAFSIATGRWRRLTPSSPSSVIPSPRYGHSAVLHHQKMIVYGGFGPGGVPATTADKQLSAPASPQRCGLLNSLYELDLHTGDWTCLASFVDSQLPSKNHTAVSYGGKMYVFGGCLPEGRTNAVRCYDIDKKLWMPSDILNQQAIRCNVPKNTQPAAPGVLMAQSDVPAPRSGHSAVLAVRRAQPTMIIFGGRLSKFSFCADVFQYDLTQQTWMRLYCGGDVPEGRCDHSAVMYRDHMVVYGGYSVAEGGTKKYYSDVYTLDLVTCTWSRVELIGSALPLGSCGHTSVMFETTDNIVCMATFGGWGRVPEPVSLADEESERTLKQHEGDLTYRTINDVWIMQLAKAPEPSSTTGGSALRPMSARSSSRQTPSPRRHPTSPLRPSTARSSTKTGASIRTNGSRRPAFVTQSSKATTAKLFGEAPMSDRVLRMTQGSPKRSTDEVQAICQRLTNTHAHESELESLRKKFLKEREAAPLTADEQQEITDRLFYQQLMLQEERRRALNSKYLPTQEHEHVSDDQIQEIISRLTQAQERPELEPMRSTTMVTKQQVTQLLQKLYKEDQKKRAEHEIELEKKYVWGPPAAKKSPAEIEEQVRRLLTPLSSRAK